MTTSKTKKATVKKKAEVQLPSKLSACIELAVKDLSAVERSKDFSVNMGNWHTPNYGSTGACSVCFAGSVMAKTVKADKDLMVLDPEDNFSSHNAKRFLALNEIREGGLEDALSCIDRPLPFGLESFLEITRYEEDPDAFKKDMLKVARLLKAVGE